QQAAMLQTKVCASATSSSFYPCGVGDPDKNGLFAPSSLDLPTPLYTLLYLFFKEQFLARTPMEQFKAI
ncbi:MAG: hypothetical protein LE180_06130, partial [Endomicrobium sp.]|uniref:hypothetical protein n=1 Tax=Candidatus Endomicrobiellum pyrsonymphae TaxID=1408203 RepID=UPI00358199E1|nr:hypothetical protein [Endomicrobium sp.]